MSGKSRKQDVVMIVKGGNISFIPKGSYQIYIYKSEIKGGSIDLSARIISSTVEKEEKDATNPA